LIADGASQLAVLGLGNLMRTDDAMGMLMLSRLIDDGRLPDGIRVIEGGTLGLDLLESLRGVTHLLALDAVDVGAAPGTLVRFAGDALEGLPISKSVHLLGFADLMGALQLMGDAPHEVVLLGVQPGSTDWGTELTAAVADAQPELMAAALAQIALWQV
jgi:hydrogenase maturation protease